MTGSVPERTKRKPSKRSSVVTLHSIGVDARTVNIVRCERDQVIGPYVWSQLKAVLPARAPSTFHAR